MQGGIIETTSMESGVKMKGKGYYSYVYLKAITFLFYRDIIEMIALCHYGCPTMHLKRVSNCWTGMWNGTVVWKIEWNDHRTSNHRVAGTVQIIQVELHIYYDSRTLISP